MLFAKILLFGITTSCHNILVSIVDFSVMLFTVPEKLHTSMKSHITKGFANNMENDENKSDKIFCRAKATAIDATHKLATNGVRFTHILVKNIKIHKTQTNTFTIISIVFFHAGFPRSNLSVNTVVILIIIFATQNNNISSTII